MTGALTKRENWDTKTGTEGKLCEGEGKDRGDASTIQKNA